MQMSNDIQWALFKNSQRGNKVKRQTIWHCMVRYNKPTGGFNVGHSCYKKDGEYYSLCLLGYPIDRSILQQDWKPKTKDCCETCVLIYNRKFRNK
jgi:hypothetical protein